MKYLESDFQRIGRLLIEDIEEDLLRAGIFYRIFFRCKSPKSLEKKIHTLNADGSAKYDGKTKHLRDLLGIRINLYFVDDLDIILKYIKNRYKDYFLEEAVDVNSDTVFKPSRINLIFRLKPNLFKEFTEIIQDKRVDATFELQLRTVFSEGWHEVEHDFRYKCQSDWENHNELSRTFNGILAALETHEYSIVKIFEQLSYSFYRNSNLSAMIRMNLRIRTDDLYLSNELMQILQNDKIFVKEFFKLDRAEVIEFLLSNSLRVPFTLDNLVFLINFFFIINQELIDRTPIILLNQFREIPAFTLDAN